MNAIAVGDVVLVRPGESIPLDSVVIEDAFRRGASPIDKRELLSEPAEATTGIRNAST